MPAGQAFQGLKDVLKLGNLVSGSSLLGLVLAFFQADEARELQEEFKAEADAREAEARGILADQRVEVGGTFEAGAAEQTRLFSEARETAFASFADTRRETLGGFDVLNQIISEGGDQERLDIEEQATQARSTARGDLAARGLSGASILPTVSQGISRERSGQIGRLEERLRGERLEVEGQRTSAIERLGFAGIELQSGFDLGFAQLIGDLSANRADLLAGFSADELNFVVNSIVQTPPPDPIQAFNIGRGAGNN